MRPPAIAVLELDSVAMGIGVADVMVKRAPVAVLKAGTVHPGRYLILVGGTVAAVEEASGAGFEAGGEWLTDHVFLPDVHDQVVTAALGECRDLDRAALGVIETRSVPSLLGAADAAVKAAEVGIARIHLADDLGGRAFVLLEGEVADVEVACQVGCARVAQEFLLACQIVPRLDQAVKAALNAGTRFQSCARIQPEGAEIDASG